MTDFSKKRLKTWEGTVGRVKKKIVFPPAWDSVPSNPSHQFIAGKSSRTVCHGLELWNWQFAWGAWFSQGFSPVACHPRAWQKRRFLDFQAVGTGGRFLSAPWTPSPVHPLWDVYGMARTVMWTRSTYWWWQPVVPGLAGYPELPTEVALNKQIFPGTASCPGVTVAVMTKIVIWDPGKGWKNSTSHSSNYHNCPYVHQHRFFF